MSEPTTKPCKCDPDSWAMANPPPPCDNPDYEAYGEILVCIRCSHDKACHEGDTNG